MAESGLRVATVSVDAWTTVAPDVSVVVRFNRPVEARSAQAGFSLAGSDLRGEVRLSEDRREATWTPLAPLPDGEHLLLVQHVTTTTGAAVTRHEVPFRVSASENRVRPYGQVLLHQSTATLRMSDRRFTVSKLLDPRSGRRYEVAVDEQGAAVDLDAIIQEDHRLYAEQHGRIHPTLLAEISRGDAARRIPVAVWLAVEERPVDKSRYDIDSGGEPPARLLAYRTEIKRAQARLAALLRRRFQLVPASMLASAPVMFLELSPAEVREVAQVEGVAALFLHETAGIDDLGTSMAISRATTVVFTQGWTGSGVRVAVWEDAADNVSQLVIQEHFDPARPTTSDHARLVIGIIKNRQSNVLGGLGITGSVRRIRGYAPSCRLYSANDKDTAALEWAVTERSCRVVNQSFHRSSEPGSGDLSFDDILKDYLVLHYPFPTIVQAAGNYWMGDPDGISPPASEFVNHKGYNSLAVANHDDTATAISGSSVFRNPTTSHGDRELPEISANGTNVTAVGRTDSGTSFASPAVAGAAALLQQMDSTLASWPEGIRAILMAGAVNVTGRNWMADRRAGVDMSDGAGALNIEASGQIARSRRGRGNRGEERGWDVGVFADGDFPPDSEEWRHVYRIRVPAASLFVTSYRVKVALAWNAMVTRLDFGLGTIWLQAAPADYDLFVFDGNKMVAWSSTWDNSYEIVEFIGQPGKTYTIRVHKASGEAGSYYGIAWDAQPRVRHLAVDVDLVNLAVRPGP
jgi:hypothetical protein